MKRKNLKPIIISALLAVGSGAASVGTSFALFTDRADTKIDVTAGIVDLDVGFSDLKLYSAQESDDTTKDLFEDENHATYYHKEMESAFANNGTVTLTADGGISVARMTPGDKFTYKISSENKSNVKTKFRLNFEAIDDDDTLALVDEIIIKAVSGTTEFVLSNYLDFKTDWVELDALETPYEEMVISVELPMTTGNAYQNLSGHFKLTEEIVQGNAHVVNEQPVEVVRTSEALAQLEEGATAKLATGEYKMPTTVADGVTIVGGEGVVIDTTDHNIITGDNVTYDGVQFDGHNSSPYGTTTVLIQSGKTVNIENCTFTGGTQTTYGSAIYVESGATANIKNCKVLNSAFRGIFSGGGANTIVNIEDCYLDAVYPFNSDGAVTWNVKNTKMFGWVSYSGGAHTTFTDCEFALGNSGYNFIRPYQSTDFIRCKFNNTTINGAAIDNTMDFTFTDCLANNVAVTVDNIETIEDTYGDKMFDAKYWTDANSCAVNGVLKTA